MAAREQLGAWDRSLWGTYAGLYDEIESRRADIERLWAEERRPEMTTTRTEMKIENVAIDSLHPDPANPRTIGKEEMKALTRSLRQFDFVQPVLARREDSIVIGGHQRLVAARRLGWKTVPVIFLDLTVEQSRLLNLALNKISGEWDQELLARMLAELKPVEDIDLSLSGFTQRSWASSSSLSTCVRRRNAWRPSTSMPRWKPHRRHTLPNVAISGGSGITACSAATRPTRATCRGCWAKERLRWPSRILPTMSASVTTAASREGAVAAASPTTRLLPGPGKPSYGPGRRTYSTTWMAPFTSA